MSGFPGVVGYKGGVARNALLKSRGLPHEEINRDIDLIWWVPEEMLDLGGECLNWHLEDSRVKFKLKEEYILLLSELEEQGDVEVWPLGAEVDYFWSRDLNVNQVWMEKDGTVHTPHEGAEPLSTVWMVQDAPSPREAARALLMGVRLGLPADLDYFEISDLPFFQLWICLLKAEEVGKGEEYARAIGHNSLGEAKGALKPKDWV